MVMDGAVQAMFIRGAPAAVGWLVRNVGSERGTK